MLRLHATLRALTLGATFVWSALAATPAQAQAVTTTNLQQLKQQVAAEIAKGPNANAGNVWGLFNQLELLTRGPYKDAEGNDVPAGALNGNADGNYTCAQIGWFLLKNVAGNAQMFQGWVWPRTNERINWALQQNNRHPQAWLLWGRIHIDPIGGPNWAEAEKGFRSDIVLNPNRLESKRYHVLSLMQLGQPQQALAAADAYLKDHPNDAKLHELRGDALFALARFTQARDAYCATAEIDLGSGQILKKVEDSDLRAQTQKTAGSGNPNWFLQWLQGYYGRHPKQFISEEWRGAVLWRIWDVVRRVEGLPKAAPWGTQCIACFAGLEKAFPEAGARAALWCDYQADVYRYDLTKLPQLEAAVLRGLAADPTSQAVMDRLNLPGQGVNLFDYYKGKEQYTAGVAFVEKLLPLLPTTTPLDRSRRAVMHQFAFECHKGLGQFTQAEASIQAAIDSDPRNSVYPNSYGLMLRYTGNTAGAIAQFRKSLEIAPSHPWAAQNLAGLLMAQGDWAAFHDHCSRALYWAQDTVEQVEAGLAETLDPQRVDGAATEQQVAAAQEAVESARDDLMKMRRLWLEGLQLQRAEAAAKKK